MRYIFYFFILIPFLLSPPYASGEKNDENGYFRSSVELASFEKEEKERYGLEVVHPLTVNSESIRKSMASLFYQKRFITWSAKKSVFNTLLIKDITPLIVERFSQADHNQRVVIRVRDSSGETVIKGDTLFTKNGLHWRFIVINGIERGIEHFSVMGEPWKLLLQSSQSYMEKRYKSLENFITSWIVCTDLLPAQSSETNKRASAPVPASIKERLLILEDLKEEGLINENEYQKKRREILDSF